MFTAGAGSTRIDVRSIWFLLLYAADLVEKLTASEREHLLGGERDNDLLDALAEVLSRDVESRMRSMLVRGYRSRTEPLTRVRGRIDHLGTARGSLMESGRILCRYEEQTVDLPRYRFMLMTLRRAAHSASSARVRRHCLTTAQMLERAGVTPMDAAASELSREQFGHFDSADQRLVQLSRLVRDMCAPEHAPGRFSLPAIVRDEHALRRLFEQAVCGFYRAHLGPLGYRVGAESRPWPVLGDSGDAALLPRLNADVVIRGHGRQVVIECKFAPLFEVHQSRVMIKPTYVRQLYAYARVFASDGPETSAVLLGALVRDSPGQDANFVLDRIPMTVRQLDLTASPSAMRWALHTAVEGMVEVSAL